MTLKEDNERDSWTRITLRLPPSLHQKLVEKAGALSLNASIIQRLEESLKEEPNKLTSYEAVRAAVMKDLRREMKEMLDEILQVSREIDDGDQSGS